MPRSTHVGVVIEVLLTAGSARREVCEAISSTDWLKHRGGAVAGKGACGVERGAQSTMSKGSRVEGWRGGGVEGCVCVRGKENDGFKQERGSPYNWYEHVLYFPVHVRAR